MKRMSAGAIRNIVREHYHVLAGGGLGTACCPAKGADRGTAALAGYESSALDAFSRKFPVFSHGCGTPVAFAAIGEGETVLDLGSGAGLDLLLAAGKTGPSGRVVGIEMAGGMVARARTAAEAWGAEHVEVREGIMEELPLEQASVDHVIFNCSVSLSPEKPRVFAEAVRALRPGGTATLCDIATGGLPQWVKENQNLYGCCIAGAPGEEEYLDLLARAGLVELRVLRRKVFSESELETFLLVGTTGSGERDPCSCTRYLAGRLLGRTAEKLTGKVGSITLTGRAPS